MSTEADARMLIDELLEAAGWAITNKAQVSTEEASLDGRADYLLKDSRTRPLAVIEAKRFAIDPYSAKEQACNYAQSLGVPFIILSNGQEHYFWDYTDGDARPIMGMPSQADLERRANIKVHRKGSLQESLSVIPYPGRFIFKGEEVETRSYQLSGLDLIKPETVKYPEPEEILASVATKEERILELIQEMRGLLEGG